MNATRWERVQEIVEQAAALAPGERTRFVDASTESDDALRCEVRDMLRVFDSTGAFMEEAIGMAAFRAAGGQELQPGERIGPYSIVSILGHGGMGTVYRAQRSDDQFRQSVAIKLVRSGFGNTDEIFLRFRVERQILANINHPNIARLLDGGITPSGMPYLVMEFVDGMSLDRWVRETNPTVAARLALFREICAAIQYAHQNLVVHRDLKPGNILIAADGTPKLLDFGIAKLLDQELGPDTIAYTRPAERLMTPEYASPEQIRGETITTATDVYGLGVLLYEMLTATRPFSLARLSPAEMERIVCETAPRAPSTVGIAGVAAQSPTRRKSIGPRVHAQTDLDRIVLKAMHKQPVRRYASAAALSTDVQRYLDGFPVEARPDSFAYRTSKFLRRHTMATTAALIFVVTIIALSINLAIQAKRARREAASADAVATYLTGLFQFTRPDATQGRSVSARDILDSGAAQLNGEWKGDPAVKSRLLDTVGVVYYQLGALDRAEPLLRQAQAIQQSIGDVRSETAAETRTALGDILTDKGDYAAAEKQYRALLDEERRVHGEESAEVANALDGMGRLYWVEGDFDRAQEIQRRAIAICTRALGPVDDLTQTLKNNYEATMADAGEFHAAEPLARELLEFRLQHKGLYNSATITSMNNYAFLLDSMGRLHGAEAMKRQVLEARRKLYGKEHPEIAMALISLGWVNRELGKLDEAKALTHEGLDMALRLEGAESLDTTFDEDAYGLVLLARGENAEAAAWMRRALSTRLGKPSPPIPLLAQSYDHLGQLDLREGRYAAARGNLEKAFAMREAFYKKSNSIVAESLIHLARLDLQEQHPRQAHEKYARALGFCHRFFGDDPNLLTAEALEGLANSERLLGDSGLAEQNAAEAQSLRTAATLRD